MNKGVWCGKSRQLEGSIHLIKKKGPFMGFCKIFLDEGICLPIQISLGLEYRYTIYAGK